MRNHALPDDAFDGRPILLERSVRHRVRLSGVPARMSLLQVCDADLAQCRAARSAPECH